MSKTGDARPPLKSPGPEAAVANGKPAAGAVASKAKVNLTTCAIVPGQDTIIEIVKVNIVFLR